MSGEGAMPNCTDAQRAMMAAIDRVWIEHIADELGIRPEVASFALLMERELRTNDHKPGWKGDTAEALVNRVAEEVLKLARAVSELTRQIVWAPDSDPRPCNGWKRRNPETRESEKGVGYEPATGEIRDELLATVAREAADTANMAMMVADVCGQLPRVVPLLIEPSDLVGVIGGARG